MCVAETKFSLLRFYLVESKRNLEYLEETLKIYNRPEQYQSEVEYWISSMDLLINCLYGCDETYDGCLDLVSAMSELKSELSNFLLVIKKFKTGEMSYLDKAWKNCKRAEELLND